jgi:hypothetical protein
MTILKTRKTKLHFALGGLVPDEAFQQYPEKVKAFLNRVGNEKITSIQVVREPINSTVKSLLNKLSLGLLDKVAQKYSIDKFFHLYLLINNKYKLEKNEVINFSTGSPSKDAQSITINNIPDKTISEFVTNTVNKIGKEAFFQYSAFKYNCQHFVKSLLQSNGISPPLSFIDQKASQIVKELPFYVEPVTNFITDLQAAFELVRQKLNI